MSLVTINGSQVTSARVNVPAWGAWYADVETAEPITLAGQVTIVIADQTLKGTVLSGGPSQGKSTFRVVGGYAGWGKVIPAKSYANDANVRVATVLTDAAREAGEQLDVTTLNDDRTGPAFVRDADQACRLLQSLARNAWYIDFDGTTKLGARPAKTYAGNAPRTSEIDYARGTLTLAPTTITDIVPGIAIDLLTVVDVQHEVTAEGGLRTTVYGATAKGAMSRRFDAYRKIADQIDPDRKYRGSYEYRVVTLEGNRVNLQPVLSSTGMPDLQRVPIRPGVAGAYSNVALGSRVVVAFVNADRSRPYVAAEEDKDGSGFVPTSTTLKASAQIALTAPSVQLGSSAATPLAHSTPTVAALNIIKAAIEGIWVAVNSANSSAPTSNVKNSDLFGFVTSISPATLDAALAVPVAIIPTTEVTGT